MARRKTDGVNKSAEIRDLLKANPKMLVKDIIATLGAKGIEAKPSLVYFIKNRMKRVRRRKIRQHAEEVGRKAGIGDPVELVLQVKSLAAKAGGYKNLKQLVEALAQ